ncbi:ferredoxin [Mycobacterium intracellulare]|uniref:ferredoxin n=1 Tax=Mycobacterium intracellulare TaxID=1767 RepID=UPI0033534CF6
MIRVEADRELCQGYANCIAAAPDVFDIDDDGIVVVLRDEVEDSERARVDESVRSCPVAALRLRQSAPVGHDR